MFTRVSGSYDRLNRAMSIGLDVVWQKRALACLARTSPSPHRILDLATGTADFAIASARRFPDAHVTRICGDSPRRFIVPADLFCDNGPAAGGYHAAKLCAFCVSARDITRYYGGAVKKSPRPAAKSLLRRCRYFQVGLENNGI